MNLFEHEEWTRKLKEHDNCCRIIGEAENLLIPVRKKQEELFEDLKKICPHKETTPHHECWEVDSWSRLDHTAYYERCDFCKKKLYEAKTFEGYAEKKFNTTGEIISRPQFFNNPRLIKDYGSSKDNIKPWHY